MLLVHPPVAKPCEPPGGIGRLYGALTQHGVKCTVLDANIEGILYLLNHPETAAGTLTDTWGIRASRHLQGHLRLLRSRQGYQKIDRYKRAVLDLNHLLNSRARAAGVSLRLADYEDGELSPVKSADLIRSAEKPEKNIFYPYFSHRLKELLEKGGDSIVGLSVNFLSQALPAFAMIGFLRREFPGLRIILGGGLITSWMSRLGGRHPFGGLVDRLVQGPGEEALLSLHGLEPRFSWNRSVPSYAPFPLQDYLAPGAVLPYSTSSGCYWSGCSFCPEKAEGNLYAPIPLEKAVKDLQMLVEKVRPSLVHILDNAIPPSFLKAAVKSPPGAAWYGFVRVTRHLTDPDFCRALKRSGCVLLKLGLESGDQQVLDGLQKGVNLEEATAALANLKETGIATYVYLLFGTPGEGLSEARKTLQFVTDRHDQVRFLNLALFNMPVADQEPAGIDPRDFYEGDLSLYVDFDHPRGWSRKKVRQFLDKEFKRHPAIASILRRTPPAFTSNHAPFFVMGEAET